LAGRALGEVAAHVPRGGIIQAIGSQRGRHATGSGRLSGDGELHYNGVADGSLFSSPSGDGEMKIVKYPHPALRHKSQTLKMIDNTVRAAAARMLELMYESKGLGLAANQVAWPFQLLVMNDLSDPEQKDREHVLINPVILERTGTIEGEEGCLSFPELYAKVRRAKTVKVQAYNLEGQAIEIEGHELTARVLQHEIDHLHGILFIDNMGPIGRLASRSSLRAFEREHRRAQERGDLLSDDELRRLLDEMERKQDGGETPPPPM